MEEKPVSKSLTEPFFPLRPHSVKEETRRELMNLRNSYWYNSDGIRQSVKLIGGYNTKRFRNIIVLSKNNLRIPRGLLTVQ